MRRASPHAPTAVWLALLAAILCLFGSHVGRTWDFTVDDAGISYSYARNLAAGYGLVLTPGSERVEAATNLLWVLLLAPADALGITHETLSKVLGLLFASGALVGVAFLPAVAYRRRPGWYDLAAPLATAMLAHVALWTAAGLENGLFQFLAVLSLVLLAREEDDPARFPWSAAALAALFATRPDGALYALAVGGAKLLRVLAGRRSRQDVVWVLTLGVGVGALELFRLAYFAYPFPNSYYTKKRTFAFGTDLTDVNSAGWTYVRGWVIEYRLEKALCAAPLLLVGLRAPVVRVALLACVAGGLFMPIYSHGDWMEEWRFLTFVAPLLMLAAAEGVRAVARVVVAVAPRSARPAVAFALTPVAAWLVLAHTTRSYPDRLRVTRSHNTLEFATVRTRAHYFAAAAHALEVRDGSVLDPDVGGMSYDSGLRVIDLFGLGDVAIAHTHPVDEPGMREAIFRERRPTFVHLHGAWFGAVQLDRLEELDLLYLHLPGVLQAEHDDGTNYVRRDILAAPWNEQAERGAGARTGTFLDGYTVSARALDPGAKLSIEVDLANVTTAVTPGAVGVLVAEPRGGGRRLEAALHPAGDIIPLTSFLPGERVRARARFALAAGHYDLRWQGEGRTVALGAVTVEPRGGAADARAVRAAMDAHLRAGRLHEARRLALALVLRAEDAPGDAPGDTDVREALAAYSRALAARALTLGEHGVFGVAADLALQARRFGGADGPTVTRVQSLAERMADAERGQQRRRHNAVAFVLARDAVLVDPQRSWMRRRAEELRPHRMTNYDGGRDAAAYRTAAAAMALPGAIPAAVPATGGACDAALMLLGEVGRWTEAAGLVDRAGAPPADARARLVAARGYLSRGEVAEALALAAAVPCATARDPEFARAFRALAGRSYRPGDALCERAVAAPAAPLDDAEGSFERGGWGGWTTVNRAFGPRPVHDMPTTQSFVNGWRGWYYASSYARGDGATGLLRSRPFVLGEACLSFLVGGGADVNTEGVRLMVDGAPVLRQSGSNTEALRRVFWDVRPWAGKTATLEAYDTATGGWGHILVDDFRAEPVCPAP